MITMIKEVKGKRVIISTFYEGYAIKAAITKLSPNKIILLIDEPVETKKKENMYQRLKSLKDFYKGTNTNILDIETTKIVSYDIPKIIKEVLKKIDEESKQGSEVIIHITEGRKITSLALLFSAYMKKDKVIEAYYITEEKHDLIKLPLLNFQINETKKELLKEIAKNHFNFKKLMKKAGIKQSALYQNIKELKQEGYIQNGKNKKLELTELGRIINS